MACRAEQAEARERALRAYVLAHAQNGDEEAQRLLTPTLPQEGKDE